MISGGQSTIRSSYFTACILKTLESLLLAISSADARKQCRSFGGELNLLVMSLRGPGVGLSAKFCQFDPHKHD